MRIDEVISETIFAIYRTPQVSRRLFLKGGSAMRLFDNLKSRLSIDADFSIVRSIDHERRFFSAIKSSVGKAFRKLKFDVIDFKWEQRPRNRGPERPKWWRGWVCQFKLVAFAHRGSSIEVKRRNALVPEGANSSVITIEISEHEYCGEKRTKTIRGVRILGYSRELLVLEKIRAICQQNPQYTYRVSKNRARDFYDIHELTTHGAGMAFRGSEGLIKKVFDAKEVPLHFLAALWDNAFIDEQRRGFDEVKDTVTGPVSDFDVYVEHLRFLVQEIYPSGVPQPPSELF